MKCSYCNQEITSGNAVKFNENLFCNNLCRYSWQNSVNQNIGISKKDGISIQNEIIAKENGISITKKILFSIVYSIIFYFLISIIGGAIVGGIAGVEAGSIGEDAAEAGRIAGNKFGQNFGLLIMLSAIVFSTLGSFKGWLPWTKRKRNAK